MTVKAGFSPGVGELRAGYGQRGHRPGGSDPSVAHCYLHRRCKYRRYLGRCETGGDATQR